MVDLIGVENATKMCIEWGGKLKYFPNIWIIHRDNLRQMIAREYINGMSIKELSEKYDYSQVGVWKIVRSLVGK